MGYSGLFFWLMVVSLFCWILERLVPWRPQQKAWRKQIGQDFFWLIFNGHYAGIAIAFAGSWLIQQLNPLLGKSLTDLPLVMLGVNGSVILWIAVVTTLIGHLNHSNLNFIWLGPLRYVINSPRMHVWHHDVILRGEYGKNFGVVLCLWDWLFGTAYLPADKDQPERLGFESMDKFPQGLLPKLVHPLFKKIGSDSEA